MHTEEQHGVLGTDCQPPVLSWQMNTVPKLGCKLPCATSQQEHHFGLVRDSLIVKLPVQDCKLSHAGELHSFPNACTIRAPAIRLSIYLQNQEQTSHQVRASTKALTDGSNHRPFSGGRSSRPLWTCTAWMQVITVPGSSCLSVAA